MSGLTGDDWRNLDEVLERKLKPLHDTIKESGSKVWKLEGRLQRVEDGSPHKCDEAIKAHETASWSHNPYKAGAAGLTIIGLIEGLRKFFHV
jgi:hypothetical protein